MSRSEEFGQGQLPAGGPRLSSRDLEPGHAVRLTVGNEGESMESRLKRGLGATGRWEAQVQRVDKAGVHVHGTFYPTTGKPYVMHPHEDPVRVNHDDIAHVSRL